MDATSGPRSRPRVVIVGGGFAGLSAVKRLQGADADVLLLDDRPYSTFQPLLYQVATGGLNPGDVTHPLRVAASRVRNARFRRGRMVGLDAAARRLGIDNGDEVLYDYLVLSAGAVPNFFGVPGAREHAHSIYSREAAARVRDTLFSNVEAVAQGWPGAIEPVVVVVGAGPTGVEMAGTLAELRNVALPAVYPEIATGRFRIVLVEMTDRVLGSFAPAVRAYAARELSARGVELRLGTAVTEVRENGVVFGDGQEMPSAATVWASGVKVADEVSEWGLPQGPGGRVLVDADMRVVGHPEIFAVGDIAAAGSDPLPQLAQPAIQTGRHAGDQIRRLLSGQATTAMRHRDKGTMATIGRSDAVLELPNGRSLRGRLAWLAWLGVHITMLSGTRNRAATFANLAVRYFSWPGGLNVIVGDPPGSGPPRPGP